MNVVDLLKKGKVNCPGCGRVFDVGPDLQALTESAGGLLEKIGNFFGDDDDDPDVLELEDDLSESLAVFLEEMAEDNEISLQDAQADLARALDSSVVQDAILDFLEKEN